MNSKFLLLVACVLSLVFVSCSKDESDGEEIVKVKNVECTIKANFYDLAEIADITITYFDEKGASKSEVVTTKTWEKKFTTATFPIKLTPQIVIKAKAGTPSKEKYDLGCSSEILYTVILTDGKTKGHFIKKTAIMTSLGYLATALDKFFEKHSNKDIELGGWTLNLNSDGRQVVEE